MRHLPAPIPSTSLASALTAARVLWEKEVVSLFEERHDDRDGHAAGFAEVAEAKIVHRSTRTHRGSRVRAGRAAGQ
jgi:hypothetical protein